MRDETQQLLSRVEAVLASGDDDSLARDVAEVRPEDIAEIFDLLDDPSRSRLLFALTPQSMAEVIARLDEAERGEVVGELTDEKLTEIVEELPLDDAADVIGELSDERVEEVLEKVGDDRAAQIEQLLEYHEESAGGIMTPELIALTGETSVGEAIRRVQETAPADDMNEIYVINGKMRLIGRVPLRSLVVNPTKTTLASICEADPIFVRAGDDQEDVVRTFRKYDLSVVPVVDEEGRLKGRITADDIYDVAEEEAAEDIYRMAGTDLAEMETASSLRAARIRLTWLLPCLLGMSISATVIALSHGWINPVAMAAIVAFVPMVGAMSGNSGIQISTVIVRGLAMGDPAALRIRSAFTREATIAFVIAPVCGLAALFISNAGLHLYHVYGDPDDAIVKANILRVSLAVGAGMTFAILVAGGLGILLPFLFRRVGVDPAIASGPFITTANDVISVTIYLILASWIV